MCAGFAITDLWNRALNACLNQAARIKKFRFAKWAPDQLQARDGNCPIANWNRYRQRRISREIHRNGVLQVRHSRF